MSDFDAPPEGYRASIVNLYSLLLHKSPLITPRYQRPYSWSSHEVERLMSDLLEAYTSARPNYFLGTIVVIEGRALEIVDGQQRLATFMLMLAALRDQFDVGSAEWTLAQSLIADLAADQARLLLRESDRPFVRLYVHTPGRFDDLCELDLDADRPTSQSSLIAAGITIAEHLESEEGLDLAGFLRFIVGGAVFNLIETSDRENAPRMFTVLNETGLDLSATDLVKSELFVRAEFSDQEADDAGRTWDGYLDRLGRQGMDELLSFMPSLARRSIFREPGDIDFYRRNFTDLIDPRQFLESELGRYTAAYEALTTASLEIGPLSNDVNRRLRCLLNLRDRYWLGVAVGFATLYENDPALFARLLQALERFAYMFLFNIVPASARRDRAERVYAALDDPQKLLGPKGALVPSRGEMRDILNCFRSPIRRDPPRRLMIVARLNAALPGGEILTARDNLSVEHILPQKARGEWLKLFPDPQVRDTLMHSCGNMTAITKPQNGAAGDTPYERKRQIYFETPGAPVFALTETLRPVMEWTPSAVRKRTEMLVEAIAQDLAIEVG